MIRKIQFQTDLADFKNWAASVPQVPEFNWTRESLIESLSQDVCWGLWHESKLQSVVCFLSQSDPTEILWLATRPERAGQGFMKKLLTEVIINTTQQGELKGGQILLEVHEKNLKAIRLYNSLGFIDFGRRKNYYKDGAKAVLMTLKVE